MLRITDIQHGRVDWPSVPYCEIPAERRGQYLLRPGDILFARTGATTGKSYLVREDVPEAVFASYLIRVRPGERLLPDFLYLYFQGADYWEYVRTQSRGTGQPNVNGTILGKLVAPVPSVGAQLEAVRLARRRLEAVARLETEIVLATKKEKVLREAVLTAATQGTLSPRAESIVLASTEGYA
jgi:type I restriction enzyme S subunit